MSPRSVVRKVAPAVRNYRGKEVRAWLGIPLMTILATFALVEGSLRSRGGQRALWLAAGVAATYLAGLLDDLWESPHRGVARQLLALGEGDLTPGVVKLVAIGGASVALAAGGFGGPPGLAVLRAFVIAGCANLWNLLDVVPGRALKVYLLTAPALVVAAIHSSIGDVMAVSLLLAIPLLILDLLEVGMLGDAGANVLGFLAGAGLAQTLSTVGLLIAAAALLGLHLLSESLTLSRGIDAIPALRWVDGLGRRKIGSDRGQREVDP